MKKATITLLGKRVDEINKLLKTPQTTFTYSHNGDISNVGNCHLYLALNVYALEMITDMDGGVERIFTAQSKGQLIHELDAMIVGIKLYKERVF